MGKKVGDFEYKDYTGDAERAEKEYEKAKREQKLAKFDGSQSDAAAKAKADAAEQKTINESKANIGANVSVASKVAAAFTGGAAAGATSGAAAGASAGASSGAAAGASAGASSGAAAGASAGASSGAAAGASSGAASGAASGASSGAASGASGASSGAASGSGTAGSSGATTANSGAGQGASNTGANTSNSSAQQQPEQPSQPEKPDMQNNKGNDKKDDHSDIGNKINQISGEISKHKVTRDAFRKFDKKASRGFMPGPTGDVMEKISNLVKSTAVWLDKKIAKAKNSKVGKATTGFNNLTTGKALTDKATKEPKLPGGDKLGMSDGQQSQAASAAASYAGSGMGGAAGAAGGAGDAAGAAGAAGGGAEAAGAAGAAGDAGNAAGAAGAADGAEAAGGAADAAGGDKAAGEKGDGKSDLDTSDTKSSKSGSGKSNSGNDSDKGKKKGNAAVKSMATTVAAKTSLILMMYVMFVLLKNLLMSLISGLVNAIMALFQNIIQAIVQLVVNIVTGLTSLGYAIGCGIFAGIMAIGAIFVGSSNNGTKDYVVPDTCIEEAFFYTRSTTPEVDDLYPDEYNETQRRVYSFFSVYGLSDNEIAALLANMECDSQYNPAAVEGMYVHGNGYDWQVLEAETFNFEADKVYTDTTVTLKDAYKDKCGLDNVKYVGIGLFKWRDNLNRKLVNYAKAMGRNWYEVDTQLMFMVSGNCCDDETGYDLGALLEEWKGTEEFVPPDDDPDADPPDNAEGTLADLTKECFDVINKGASDSSKRSILIGLDTVEQRTDIADRILSEIAGTYVYSAHDDKPAQTRPAFGYDEVYGNSILDMAKIAIVTAEDNGTARTHNMCSPDSNLRNNLNLATASEAFAWPSKKTGADNKNGTTLYQRVNSSIIIRGTAKMSAEKRAIYEDTKHGPANFLATAVMWAGCDDTYPVEFRGCGELITFMYQSDRFTLNDMWESNEDNLVPGDILIYANADETNTSEDIAAIYLGKGKTYDWDPKNGELGEDVFAAHGSRSGNKSYVVTCDTGGTPYVSEFKIDKYKKCYVYQSRVKMVNSKYKNVAYRRTDAYATKGVVALQSDIIHPTTGFGYIKTVKVNDDKYISATRLPDDTIKVYFLSPTPSNKKAVVDITYEDGRGENRSYTIGGKLSTADSGQLKYKVTKSGSGSSVKYTFKNCSIDSDPNHHWVALSDGWKFKSFLSNPLKSSEKLKIKSVTVYQGVTHTNGSEGIGYITNSSTKEDMFNITYSSDKKSCDIKPKNTNSALGDMHGTMPMAMDVVYEGPNGGEIVQSYTFSIKTG